MLTEARRDLGASSSQPSADEWKVLRDLCRGFASAATLDEAADASAGWVRAALAAPEASVRICFPDSADRLRVVWGTAEAVEGGRRRSARRRAAFSTRSPLRFDLASPPGSALALLPLVSRGEPLGVLEVVAPREAIDGRWETLGAVASQLAIAVRHVRNQERLRGELMTIRETIALSRTLSAARSPKGAARAAARFVSERFRVPVAVWCASDDSPELRLMDVFGVGARRRRELRATMPTLARLGAGASRAREAARERFSATLGVGAPDVVDSGDAVMFVGSSDSPHGGVLDVVGGMLAEALRRRSVEANPDERSRELGLALTAHELRSPLLGVKAALEVMLLEGGGVDHRGDVLSRSLDELGQLADLVEGLLGWAVGTRPLRSRTVDLVPLVDEVVRRCDSGGSRVVIHASPTALVHVDPVHMRTAVANLIRNALAYSRTDSKVEVTVEAGAESVELAVRNVGPQVSAEGPSSVFEPLVRRDAIDANPNGSGLGLFIARRVIEAHDGWIWFEPSEDGSTFFVRLPGASQEPSSP